MANTTEPPFPEYAVRERDEVVGSIIEGTYTLDELVASVKYELIRRAEEDAEKIETAAALARSKVVMLREKLGV